MSELKKDEFDNDFGKKVAKNKFVVGLSRQTGKFVIAFSNMDANEYHRNIFERIPRVTAASGGYIGLDEEGGKKKVRFVRSSSDYGFYSKEVLEQYRPFIEKKLQEVLQSQDVELSIAESSNYE